MTDPPLRFYKKKQVPSVVHFPTMAALGPVGPPSRRLDTLLKAATAVDLTQYSVALARSTVDASGSTFDAYYALQHNGQGPNLGLTVLYADGAGRIVFGTASDGPAPFYLDAILPLTAPTPSQELCVRLALHLTTAPATARAPFRQSLWMALGLSPLPV